MKNIKISWIYSSIFQCTFLVVLDSKTFSTKNDRLSFSFLFLLLLRFLSTTIFGTLKEIVPVNTDLSNSSRGTIHPDRSVSLLSSASESSSVDGSAEKGKWEKPHEAVGSTDGFLLFLWTFFFIVESFILKNSLRFKFSLGVNLEGEIVEICLPLSNDPAEVFEVLALSLCLIFFIFSTPPRATIHFCVCSQSTKYCHGQWVIIIYI